MRLSVLIGGVILFLLSIAVLVISLLLPSVISPRNVTWSEALAGIIPAAACSFLSFLIAIVGLILVLTRKKSPGGNGRASNLFADEEERH